LLEQYNVPATFFITGIRRLGYNILWNDVISIARRYGPAQFSFQGEEFIKDSNGKYFSYQNDRMLADVLRQRGFEDKAEMMDRLGVLKQNVPEDYWLQMTTAQIKEMSASKWVTIGSHSDCHNDLAKMPAGLREDDLRQSKSFLENITGLEVKALAFPYGSYSPAVVEKAKNAGYTQLLTTGFLFPGDDKDPALRERLTINPFISPVNQMHANISGNYR
jgi:peptidoglycan/xylan/chitin deacetylase (PgdA/CDA1 family)